MVATVGKITAGSGYDYLTRAVAGSKHDYYTGAGEAPGVWAGRGRTVLDLDGEVGSDQMMWLFGLFIDPRSAVIGVDPATRRARELVTLGQPIDPAILRGEAVAREQVAAFDVTFSASKSVSLLWAMSSDESVRAAVVAAHDAAVEAGLAYLETHAGHARVGRGGVRRIDTGGLIAAKFRHRTARTTDPGRVGDPQLHTHVAILNRVQCVDGKWRTLDGQAIYAHAHTAGAVYGAVLERELTERVGVSWATPEGRVLMREIDGISGELRGRFSSRRAQVLDFYDRLETEWRRIHHRSPTGAERAAMMDDATVRSRLGKVKGDGDSLHDVWRTQLTAADQAAVDAVVHRPSPSDGGRLPAGSTALADRVFDVLHGQRSWWTRAHLHAEVSRLIDTTDPEAVEVEVERLVGICVNLEPDDDPTYARPDRTKFTSSTILDAEQRILRAADTPAPFIVPALVEHRLGDDQRAAVVAIARGDAVVTTVIGPAGAGKTTMLQSVAESYRRAGRAVCVLALAANAAQVVTEETGLPADTIAAWQTGTVTLPRDGLVIIDEASMVPTLTLDALIDAATRHRSRVALIGDYAQMGSPEAGGLLRDLADTDTAIHLNAVRRFRNDWERTATIRLRERDPHVAATYDTHERITGTTTPTAVDDTVTAWATDVEAGRETMIIVDTADQAATISARCQQHLVTIGHLGPTAAVAADTNQIRIGDLIQSRRNTRHLTTSDGRRVLNRDVWTVTGVDPTTGTVTARHLRRHTTVAFTPDYLANDVVLAYATTTMGAQGRTVDTAHTIITPHTTAAALYVAMTRGRLSNHAHVITDSHHHDEHATGTLTPTDAFAAAIVRVPDGQRSATTTATRWATNAADRAAQRDADQRHQHATRFWNHHRRAISDTLRRRNLDRRDRDIIAILVRYPTYQWATALTRAVHDIRHAASEDSAEWFLGRLELALQHAFRPGTSTVPRDAFASLTATPSSSAPT